MCAIDRSSEFDVVAIRIACETGGLHKGVTQQHDAAVEKDRRDRRPGLAIENPLIFYPRYWLDIAYKHFHLAGMIVRYGLIRRRLKKDPNAKAYTDLALTPVIEDEFDALEMFAVSDAARAAVEKKRWQDDQRAKVAAG